MRICALATLNARKQHSFSGGDDSLDALTMSRDMGTLIVCGFTLRISAVS